MKAWLNLRHTVPERAAAFTRGLERYGYTVRHGVTSRPGDHDILVTWNRIQEGRIAAQQFEARGLQVLCAENATWGNDFAGGRWYTLARGVHNTAGRFDDGGPERWDALGVGLMPWRTSGETVLLPQRGIGPPGTAMPRGWPQEALRRFPGARVRQHPGTRECVPLMVDLCNAGRVVTWGSGAAVIALMAGVPVVSDMPHWIGAQDNTDEGRLSMLRRLAWAQWRLDEIENGTALDRLLIRAV